MQNMTLSVEETKGVVSHALLKNKTRGLPRDYMFLLASVGGNASNFPARRAHLSIHHL